MRDRVVEALRRAAEESGGRLAYVKREEAGDPEPGPRVSEAGLAPRVASALEALGYERLYRFQHEAYRAWASGSDVFIVSGTGTGKTEAFMIPALETALEGGMTVILYPTKALARDQMLRIQRFASAVGVGAAVLDGDTPREERSRIYEDPPGILVTNPDMLHYGMAFSDRFRRLVSRASLVVLDEAHVYRGVFGSHVRWVLYRLERIAGRPRFVLAGATVGNPEDLAWRLTGRKPAVVRGPPRRRGSLVHVMVDAGRSGRVAVAASLIAAAARSGLKVLGFAEGQQSAELIARVARERYGVAAEVHRAGLPAEARRSVEDRFRRGDLMAVVATTTLELGVDIGDLDVVVMAQLPKSYSSYLQRAGRAGRRGRTGYAVTVLADDAVESYYLRRPEEYFLRGPEPSFIEPSNREVARVHAAALLLGEGGAKLEELPEELRLAVEDLAASGLARVEGGFARPVRSRARRLLEESGGLRSSGPRVRIVEEGAGEIGWREMPQALYDLYPGAVYMHAGRTYLVSSLDLDRMEAVVRRVEEARGYYTRPLYTADVVSMAPLEERRAGPLRLVYAEVKLTIVIEGYSVRDASTGRQVAEVKYQKPIAWTFTTLGVATRYPVPAKPGEGDPAAVHALEHALLQAAKPVVGASDSDLGGVGYPSGHIVIYDSVPGGNGASRLVYERFERVEDMAETILASCSCQEGCPRCVYSPHCGHGNRRLSRRRALRLLQARFLAAREVKLGPPEGAPLA